MITELALPKARVTIRDPARRRPTLLGRVTVALANGEVTASRRGRVYASGAVDAVELLKAKVWRLTVGETVWDVDANGCGCGR